MSDLSETVSEFTRLILQGPRRVFAAWTDEERAALDRFVRLSLTSLGSLADDPAAVQIWWCGEYGAKADATDQPSGWCRGFNSESEHRQHYGCGLRVLRAAETGDE